MPKSAESRLLSTEDTRAVQRAVEAALAVVLQERKKKPTTEPPPPVSEVEQQIAKAAADPTKRPRDRHGFRGTPPPAHFSLTELPDDSLLTEYEVASLARLSTNTLAAWRKRERDHPLNWVMIGSGRVRYRAGDVREFIASGRRPEPGRPKKKAAPNVAQDAAPPRRRAARRAKADDFAAPQEQSR